MIQTKRLQLIPLSLDQLELYIALDGKLEQNLGIKPYPRTISKDLHTALTKVIIPRVRTLGGSLYFATIWTAIDQYKEVMVGDICFKGNPDSYGNAEIGYGTYPDFQQLGYMTEMVGAFTSWGLAQEGVKSILAETHLENKASQKVLERCGYDPYETKPPMIWWKCLKPM